MSTPPPAPLSEADYGAIESAVLETNRGRWFLAEYTRRNRNADTTMLLAALERIEGWVKTERGGGTQPTDRMRLDLVDMAQAIARTKAEIAAIKPDAEQHGKFGDATEELDAIVQATETATSDILASAEQIQEIAWTMREQGFDGEVCDLLDSKATDVYTSCSFQDLTGQRTRKVIQVLRYLEGRINAMIGIWGLDGAMAAEAAEKPPQRLLGALAEDVPERDVDAGKARQHDALATVVVGRLIDLLPQIFRPAGILPDDERSDLCLDHRRADGVRSAPHGRLAPADDVRVVGVNLDQQSLAGPVFAAGISEGMRHFIAKPDGLDAGDAHGTLLAS